MDAVVVFVALSAAPLGSIVKGLGADEYSVRERASRQLDGLLAVGCPRELVQAVRLHLHHRDLEVRRRVKWALARHRARVRAALVPTFYRRMPVIDALPRSIVDEGLTMAGIRPGDRGGPAWDRYRRATAFYADKLYYEDGQSPAEIVAFLDKLAWHEVTKLVDAGQEREALDNIRPFSAVRLHVYARLARRWLKADGRPWRDVARLVFD